MIKPEFAKTVELLEFYRTVDPTGSVAALTVLLASSDGKQLEEIRRDLNLTDPSALSHILNVLSIYGRGKKSGLGLMTLEEDPQDRRYKRVKFTPKGREVHEKLMEILGGNQH